MLWTIQSPCTFSYIFFLPRKFWNLQFNMRLMVGQWIFFWCCYSMSNQPPPPNLNNSHISSCKKKKKRKKEGGGVILQAYLILYKYIFLFTFSHYLLFFTRHVRSIAFEKEKGERAILIQKKKAKKRRFANDEIPNPGVGWGGGGVHMYT